MRRVLGRRTHARSGQKLTSSEWSDGAPPEAWPIALSHLVTIAVGPGHAFPLDGLFIDPIGPTLGETERNQAPESRTSLSQDRASVQGKRGYDARSTTATGSLTRESRWFEPSRVHPVDTYGYLLDTDWAGRDPDERLRSYRHDVPFLDSTHYFIAATLTADASPPARPRRR
jgi:hypothetical protein